MDFVLSALDYLLGIPFLGWGVQIGFIYKALAWLYSRLLLSIRFCWQVVQYEPSRWLTCPYGFVTQHSEVCRVLGLGSLLVLAQLLVIVGFYYIWLALVIIVLVCVMVRMVLFSTYSGMPSSLLGCCRPLCWPLKELTLYLTKTNPITLKITTRRSH